MKIAIYILAVVAANFSAFLFGPAITPFNSFLFIGLDLSLRDSLHDSWSGHNVHGKMAALILIGGAISYMLNPSMGQIALASSVSFVMSAFADHFAYASCSNRHFLVRSNTSNIAGAAVDSVVFPTMAFGTLMPEIILAQFVAKTAGGFIWSVVLHKYARKAA